LFQAAALTLPVAGKSRLAADRHQPKVPVEGPTTKTIRKKRTGKPAKPFAPAALSARNAAGTLAPELSDLPFEI
jgi:hypothetical protein